MIYLGNWFSRRDDEISLSSKLSVLSSLSLGRGEVEEENRARNARKISNFQEAVIRLESI